MHGSARLTHWGVGGHEILPGGGQVAARAWPPELPTGGQWLCPC